MDHSEGISSEELKYFLTRQVKSLLILKKVIILLIIVVCIALIGHVIYYFNHLTTLRYDVVTAQSQVYAALQYRANLIPVLIESVVSFVEHEDNVFNRAVDARERSLRTNIQEKVKKDLKIAANSPMENMLKKIIAVAEQYPALTSSAPFQQLMTDVTKAEMQLYENRVVFNDKVNVYTTAISMFPGNMYATLLFSFPMFDYFYGSKDSEWPHFIGKPHKEWPQVEPETTQKGKIQ
ncbi:MAG: mamQ [Candidatus Magnetoglobus multicellularis str. Araruama]|uniref:MamQ n=2 Tax=Candidatus Magnetoglobus multicellularis TaxID=418099 RepID=F4ZYU8_9BACT|nr:MamQ [Candidatus Magnetoglobus multicellularis]ETR64744.1 MAG: mamQ [Candidatus Magnetoglobus multicellularis str. Araruama]